jgi:hypothetical protein
MGIFVEFDSSRLACDVAADRGMLRARQRRVVFGFVQIEIRSSLSMYMPVTGSMVHLFGSGNFGQVESYRYFTASFDADPCAPSCARVAGAMSITKIKLKPVVKTSADLFIG